MVKALEDEYKTVGEILREAREKRKYKITSASNKTKIRVVYLEAIEDNRFGDLPGPTYASGFIRTYASFLGLNPNDIYDRFKAESSEEDVKNSLVMREIEEEEPAPKRKELFLGLAALLVLYGIWYAWSSAGVKEEEPSAVVEAEDADALIVNEDTASSEPLAKTEIAVAESSENKAANAVVVAEGEASVKEEVKAESKTETKVAPKSRVKLVANSQTWIQVSRDTKIIASKVLEEGEGYDVPMGEGILLRTGNAGGLDVYVDGENIGTIGPKGAVKSGVLLDAEALLLR